ncbi:MAG: DNA mismatch repair endonuclease MutL [Methanomicrobiales archaeon]|nr:DNA mismatch repair endonuclease MutL [Methanomicrobiales archaeon]
MKPSRTPKKQQSRIRLLDEETINRIAAGEVVERPASVVKELAENAIDAGAKQIRIEIRTDPGGISRIRVTDDGSGMDAAEARLAFTRHATSKITSWEDLSRVASMGFRGEALASIAAVSRVTLVTKPADDAVIAGTRLVIDGGEIVSEEAAGTPAGTSITVEDLFAATPARKKFLKRKATELAHIYTAVERCALAHPRTAFLLVQDGAEKIRTYGRGGLFGVISALYGTGIARSLVPVNGTTPYMRIEGYVGRPDLNRQNAQMIVLSVNERQITSNVLLRAIRAGFGTLLPKNRYPVVFLALNIDTALVDVNVHPAKKEIRLSREDEIVRDLAAAIRTSLGDKELIARGTPAPGGSAAPAPAAGVAESHSAYRIDPRHERMPQQPLHAAFGQTDTRLRLTEHGAAGAAAKVPGSLTVLGQIDTAYIVVVRKDDAGEAILLIDQHAAHERVLYEQVLAKRERETTAQELIVPVILTLRSKEAEIVRGARHALMTEGFLVEEFGGDSFAVRTVPVILGRQVAPDLVRDCVADIAMETRVSAENVRERITTVIACRGAIKAGTPLSAEQMQKLVDQLVRSKNPWTCPHGRPTMVIFGRNELDGMFRRT